jgi:hypothetical protein
MVLDLGGFGTNLEAKVRCFFKKNMFLAFRSREKGFKPLIRTL